MGRTPDYKLIWASDDQHALYDLHADPHETTNCFADEPKLAAEMMETLQAWKPPDGTPLPCRREEGRTFGAGSRRRNPNVALTDERALTIED